MKTYKVEITEEFIKEAHAVACPDWKTKIENLIPDAFEPEANKWYKHDNKVFFITDFDEEGHANGYGIGGNGEWVDARDVTLDLCICSKHFVNDLIPTTEKEVEEMLTQEAEKRGLVQGVEVKSLLSGFKKRLTGNYQFINNNFYADTVCGNVRIFKDGVWVKPIKNKTLKRIEALETELAKLKSEL